MNEAENSNTDEKINNTMVLENEVQEAERGQTVEQNLIENKTGPSAQTNPKKQIRNKANWKTTKRKNDTLAGKQHISKSGKSISSKVVKPGCAPCRKKCVEKISEVRREEIFKNYCNKNKTGDIKRQFVLSRIKTTPTKRKRPADHSRDDQRKQTIRYTFVVDGRTIEVCKVFFLNTLGISETVVRNAFKKI